MKLNKIQLREIIIPYSEKCNIPNLTADQVSGINRDKEFFEPARQVGENTSNYQVVPPNYFACNLMHVGRDVVLPIAYNHSGRPKYVSPAYTIFSLNNKHGILNEYFFLMLNSNERDRYFWFHADSSIRDGMSLEDFCNLEITIPDLSTQQKYVDIYLAMLANQQNYERGLEDLKLVCDGYIEELRRNMPCEKIGPYLIESEAKNNCGLAAEKVVGLSTSKEIIPTKANLDGVNISSYKLFLPKQIAYVPDTSRRKEKIALAINGTNERYLVSSISTVFGTEEKRLLSEYLMLFLCRSEFDRYARFHSWGSAREAFEWEALCDFEIPIPDIRIQKAISEINSVCIQRKEINEKLKRQIKDVCPILIKGSLEE